MVREKKSFVLGAPQSEATSLSQNNGILLSPIFVGSLELISPESPELWLEYTAICLEFLEVDGLLVFPLSCRSAGNCRQTFTICEQHHQWISGTLLVW